MQKDLSKNISNYFSIPLEEVEHHRLYEKPELLFNSLDELAKFTRYCVLDSLQGSPRFPLPLEP